MFHTFPESRLANGPKSELGPRELELKGLKSEVGVQGALHETRLKLKDQVEVTRIKNSNSNSNIKPKASRYTGVVLKY